MAVFQSFLLLPQRFTASDRIQIFLEKSLSLIESLEHDAQSFLSKLGYEEAYVLDLTDGFRITLKSGDVVHLDLQVTHPSCDVMLSRALTIKLKA